MRAAIFVVLTLFAINACSNYRPGAMPTVMGMQEEAELRNHAAERRQIAEQRKSLSNKEKKLEEAAAGLAALAAIIFAGDGAAVVGLAGDFDENKLFEDHERTLVPPADTNEETKPVYGPTLEDKRGD